MEIAKRLALAHQNLLVSLDAIPFPQKATDDLRTFKKVVVALQIFWSSVDTNSPNWAAYRDERPLVDEYNQTSIVLGHDVGVTLVLQKPSPSP